MAVSAAIVIRDNSYALAVIRCNFETALLFAKGTLDYLGDFIKRNLLAQSASLCQSTCRAKLDTKTAVITASLVKRKVEFGRNNRRKASADKSESVYIHNLRAGTYTQSAKYALVGVTDYKFI